jgi:hypothetical protein
MAISHNTDGRLRHQPDSSQQRERLCAALLSLDNHFSRIVLRHPKGSTDQGCDTEAVLDDHLLAFGAVSFLNDADDSVWGGPFRVESRLSASADAEAPPRFPAPLIKPDVPLSSIRLSD